MRWPFRRRSARDLPSPARELPSPEPLRSDLGAGGAWAREPVLTPVIWLRAPVLGPFLASPDVAGTQQLLARDNRRGVRDWITLDRPVGVISGITRRRFADRSPAPRRLHRRSELPAGVESAADPEAPADDVLPEPVGGRRRAPAVRGRAERVALTTAEDVGEPEEPTQPFRSIGEYERMLADYESGDMLGLALLTGFSSVAEPPPAVAQTESPVSQPARRPTLAQSRKRGLRAGAPAGQEAAEPGAASDSGEDEEPDPGPERQALENLLPSATSDVAAGTGKVFGRVRPRETGEPVGPDRSTARVRPVRRAGSGDVATAGGSPRGDVADGAARDAPGGAAREVADGSAREVADGGERVVVRPRGIAGRATSIGGFVVDQPEAGGEPGRLSVRGLEPGIGWPVDGAGRRGEVRSDDHTDGSAVGELTVGGAEVPGSALIGTGAAAQAGQSVGAEPPTDGRAGEDLPGGVRAGNGRAGGGRAAGGAMGGARADGGSAGGVPIGDNLPGGVRRAVGSPDARGDDGPPGGESADYGPLGGDVTGPETVSVGRGEAVHGRVSEDASIHGDRDGPDDGLGGAVRRGVHRDRPIAGTPAREARVEVAVRSRSATAEPGRAAGFGDSSPGIVEKEVFRAPARVIAAVQQRLGVVVDDVPVRRGRVVGARAKKLGVRAFTAGGVVHLPAEAGDLDSPETEALLAHELTHVAQQRILGPGLPTVASAFGQQLEEVAQGTESWVRSGRPIPLLHRSADYRSAASAVHSASAHHSVSPDHSATWSSVTETSEQVQGSMLGATTPAQMFDGAGPALPGSPAAGEWGASSGTAAPPEYRTRPDDGHQAGPLGAEPADFPGSGGPSWPGSDPRSPDHRVIDAMLRNNLARRGRPEPALRTDPALLDRVERLETSVAEIHRASGGAEPADQLNDSHFLQRLADRLYGDFRHRLRGELLIDRERRGALADLG